jgi:non-ribosomal peptide synthase protein (TIGR01720 family)
MFPVRLDIAQSPGVGEALKSVKEQLRQIPDRGIGFGILRYLSADAGVRLALQSVPQPAVSFNYLGQVNQTAAENTPLGVEAAPESFGAAFSPLGGRRHLIDIIGIVVGGTLKIDWAFSGAVL